MHLHVAYNTATLRVRTNLTKQELQNATIESSSGPSVLQGMSTLQAVALTLGRDLGGQVVQHAVHRDLDALGERHDTVGLEVKVRDLFLAEHGPLGQG